MDRTFVWLGALSGFVAVAAGAFGAHALKARLPPDMLDVWKTGAQYEMYHALALVLVGLWLARSPSTLATVAGWLFAAGTVLFAGSLYALALSGVRALGAVTPFGGLCFLGGWALLAFAAMHK